MAQNNLLQLKKCNELKYTKIYNKEKQKLKRELVLIISVKAFAILVAIFFSSTNLAVTIPISILVASGVIIYRISSFYSSKKYFNVIKNDGLMGFFI